VFIFGSSLSNLKDFELQNECSKLDLHGTANLLEVLPICM
jgi:hypothetical protein